MNFKYKYIMLSLIVFAIIILLVLVLINRPQPKEEFLIRDYRPNAYLIYTSDQSQCHQCDDVVKRFVLNVGRRDRYVAHMWDVMTARNSINKFSEEHKIPIRTLPTLIVERDGIFSVHEGTETVNFVIRDMI